ncbi:hypothetical protein QAD02_006639 [Eretmocerus hayati]|uniref:Uncharacterized protein n=1 Tax=Eretmocerus hayati TaxID=131215 RepID=A0ACC2N3S4_9HYME|nr:hypothetical protein QAD02_006639 [Eretmocerus hayati]
MEVKKYVSTLTPDQKELYTFVRKGYLSAVQKLLKPFPVLSGDKKWFDYWLLVVALKAGRTEVANYLISKNCRVEIPERTKTYCTPFYYACELYDSEVLAQELITRGASIRGKDANNKTPIQFSLDQRNVPIIDVILKNCSLLLSRDGLQKSVDLFHVACWRGNVDIVKEFINRGISLQSPSNFESNEWSGYTPLHFAVRGTKPEIFDLLLQNNADINITNQRGDTPLHLAFMISEHHTFICDTILEKHIRNMKINKFSNPKNKEDISHLHIVCSIDVFKHIQTAEQKTQYLNIFKFYLNDGVDVNHPVNLGHRNYAGYTALHFAVSNSALEITRTLLECGADPKIVDEAGRTPLHLLCKKFVPYMRFKFPTYRRDNEAIVELLLNHGAEIDCVDVDGNTPLHLAFHNEAENNSIIDLLISKKDMDTNLTNKDGLSYLHIACSRSNLSTVKNLVSNGASINSRVSSNAPYFTEFSLLHIAVLYNQKEIVEYLLEHGADANATITHLEKNSLHFACQHSYRKFFKFSYLFDEKISSGNEIDVDWQSHRKDQYGIIRSLLKFGTPINIRDRDGHTPLSLACRIPVDFIMEDYNGPPNGREYYRNNLLNEIRIRQNYVVDILLRHGAEIKDRSFPILQAIVKDMHNEETHPIGYILLDKLLKRGVNVNSVVDQLSNLTVLHAVVEYSPDAYALELLTKLLEEPRIDVNAKYSRQSETPLHIAVRLNKGALVKKLLESGADIHAENHSGLTPIKLFCNDQLFRASSDYSILVQFRIGMHRDLIFEPAKKVLRFLTKVDWPESCYYLIFKYLSNVNLETLINIKIDEKPAKRQADQRLSKRQNPSKKCRAD